MKDRMKVLIAYSIAVVRMGHPDWDLDVKILAKGINHSAQGSKLAGADVVTPEDVKEVLETLGGLGLAAKR